MAEDWMPHALKKNNEKIKKIQNNSLKLRWVAWRIRKTM